MSCYQAGQTGAPGFVVIDLGLKNCPYTNNTNLLEPYCWLKFIYASGLTLYFVYMCELYGMCTQLGWLLLLWTLAFYREEYLRSVCTSLFILAGNDATFEDKTFKVFMFWHLLAPIAHKTEDRRLFLTVLVSCYRLLHMVSSMWWWAWLSKQTLLVSDVKCIVYVTDTLQ